MTPASLRPPPEKVPSGWKTVEGWSNQWKLSYAQTHRILTNALRARTVRRKNFRTKISSGYIRPVPHYGSK